MTDFVKKAKLTELENKIPDISNLATKPALITVENKMADVSSLVKKWTKQYAKKITEVEKKLNNYNHDKHITTPECNALAADVFNVRLAQANLIRKEILMLNCRVLTEKLLQIKRNTCLLKIN